MEIMQTFLEAKQRFDNQYSNSNRKYTCFLPVHLTQEKNTYLKKTNGDKNEEYYKWQFLYSIVNCGLFTKDYIGTEIQFPKGNKSSVPLKIDAAIFDNIGWWDKYKDYHNNKNNDSLEWLREHLLVTIEFKKEDNKNISDVWNKQLKAYLNESRRAFCLGILYDTERLYLFRKQNNKFLRYSEEFNTKGMESKNSELSLHLTDPYINIPNFETLEKWTRTQEVDRSQRSIADLDIVSSVHSTQVNDSMSNILRTMDKVGMVNQSGFEILIQILALKIFDEKNNNNELQFYITNTEKDYSRLSDSNIQEFINRIIRLRERAIEQYHKILENNEIDFQDENHIKLLIEVISQFQDYSFVGSQKTDLYQLIFYQFASKFSKDEKAQFVTPLPLIDFLVQIVNPRNRETVIDPTVGIADFLSMAYVNPQNNLDDANIYGMDTDKEMVMLASLNMLLNGDGNATIEAKSGYGSIINKFDNRGGILELDTNTNKKGNWDKRADNKRLKKFDVVLTNPPFGEGRAFVPKNDNDKQLIECYELWHRYGSKGKKKNQAKKIDMGVVFLENAYRILKENGRLGIVLSNSIASIDSHKVAREWLMEKMRIVAIFDLPANVFAETGVNTSLLIAYKPNDENLKNLQEQNYQIFSKDIKKVGYEVKTIKRVKYFAPIYKINYQTFEIETDQNGKSILDEEFTQTVQDFKAWCVSQEAQLKNIFIEE